jgi:hypothetical protein
MSKRNFHIFCLFLCVTCNISRANHASLAGRQETGRGFRGIEPAAEPFSVGRRTVHAEPESLDLARAEHARARAAERAVGVETDDGHVGPDLAPNPDDDLVPRDAVSTRGIRPETEEPSLGAASWSVRRKIVSGDLLLCCRERLASIRRSARGHRTGRRKPGTERSRSRGGCGSSSNG